MAVPVPMFTVLDIEGAPADTTEKTSMKGGKIQAS